MSDSTDSTMIQASLEGDRNAFTVLVERYQPVVYRTVRRMLGNSSESEDAVQEIFIRAMVSLPKFDRHYSFAPWILKITGNYCIDQIRRRKARKYKLWSDLSEIEERNAVRNMSMQPYTQDSDTIDKSRYLEVAQSLLNQLNPRRRMAFVLREIEGRDYEEIAAILGVTETTVRVCVWRARNDLNRKFLQYLKKRRESR
jgi:RNA polymerase sigma-70 factor, ECF subfamily